MRLNKEDIKPNMLVQESQTLYKVSTLHERYFTAQVLYPLEPRTTVRSLSYTGQFRVPTARMIEKYEQAWGFAPTGTA